jgi:prepilin-type N-terminal cleavage/methylation domain-containing protein
MKTTPGLDAHGSMAGSEGEAFTLIELLAVMAIVALLAVTLLPARAASQTKSQSIRCMDNLRQVMGAMMMYTHDNHDLFPPNPDDGGTTPAGYRWCAGQVYGGMPGIAPGAYTFNPDILADPRQCLLTTYLNTNVRVFRCTADPRMGLYQGTNATQIGTQVPAARTISMSCAVGTIDATFISSRVHSGVPNLPVPGVWLTGVSSSGNSHNNIWRTYGKTSDMIVPAPSSLLVVTEEDPFSINDGVFATSVATPQWVDWPSTLHNMGCVVSFGDGHAELHRWVDPSTRLTTPAYTATLPPSTDWNWLSQRVSVRY